MEQKFSIDQIKQKTMELLGTTNPEDVSYITEEYLAEDFQQLSESSEKVSTERLNLTWYGHSMSYGYREGVGDVYNFKSGSDPRNLNTVCGNGSYWAAFSHWDHYGTDRRCGSAEYQRVLRFVNRFQ